MSVIEKKSYKDRVKRTEFPKKISFRKEICIAIDECLSKKPKDFEEFISLLEQSNYEIKRGKYVSVKGKWQKRFIRLRSLGDGYREEDIKGIISGKFKEYDDRSKLEKLNLLIDIQDKIINKGAAYERWATNFNLKSMSKTLLFLRDHQVESIEELKMKEYEATSKFNCLSTDIKAKEGKIAELTTLKKHIFNYVDTRDIYIQYRKSVYNKQFFEQHREAITLHKAAKQAFNESDIDKIPNVKELNSQIYELMNEKKEMYAEYRQLKNEMQELMKARKNVERFLADEMKNDEKEKESERKNDRVH